MVLIKKLHASDPNSSGLDHLHVLYLGYSPVDDLVLITFLEEDGDEAQPDNDVDDKGLREEVLGDSAC